MLTATIVLAGCDPTFTYCATVTDCADGMPVEDIEVFFNGVVALDARSEKDGRACAGTVGAQTPHQVLIVPEKEGFRSGRLAARTREKRTGVVLDVAVCVCRDSAQSCQARIVTDGTGQSMEAGVVEQ